MNEKVPKMAPFFRAVFRPLKNSKNADLSVELCYNLLCCTLSQERNITMADEVRKDPKGRILRNGETYDAKTGR